MKTKANAPGDAYAGLLRKPEINFGSVRDGRNSTLFYFDVDLSVARSATGNGANRALVVPVAGDSLYCDKDPAQGYATVHVQDIALSSVSAPVYMDPGFIADVPFTQLLIENTAQAGKRLRVFYGVGVNFTPGSGGSVTVSNSPNVITPQETAARAGTVFANAFSKNATFANSGGANQQVAFMLANPAANTKSFVINPNIRFLLGGSQVDVPGLDGFHIGIYNNLAGIVGAIAPGGTPSYNGNSATTGIEYWTSAVGTLPIGGIFSSANSTILWTPFIQPAAPPLTAELNAVLQEPPVVLPGSVFFIAAKSPTGGCSLYAGFSWREV